MPDINTYSLSLQLNLESNAPEVLDDVSSRLDQINEQIAQIGSMFGTALGGAAEDLADFTDQIASSMTEINGQLDIAKPILDGMKDQQKDQVADLESALDINEQTTDEYRAQIQELTRAISLQTEALTHVRGLRDGTGDIRDNTKGIADRARGAVKNFFDMYLGITAIKNAFKSLVELEEQFITSNYRLYGAQEEILRQVNDISDEYGLLRGTAQEAMKSLAISLRVPREELGKYVAQVSMFHRATGASIEQTGDWIRSMTLAGFTSRDTERSLGRMVLMMRTAGFTTAQINKLLSQQSEWSALLASSYGKDGVEAFNAGSAAMAALTREVHGDTDAMMALFDSIVRVPSAMHALHQYSTLSEDSLAGMDRAQRDVLKSASGMLNYFAEIDARTQGLNPAEAGLQFKAMGQVLGLTGVQTEKLNIALKTMREEMGLTDPALLLDRLKPMMEQFQSQNDLLGEFGDSMATVKAAWEDALRPLLNAWMNLMIALKPVMQVIIGLVGVLVDVLAFLINTVAAIINPIAAFKRNLEGVNEAGEETVGFFKRLGGGIVNLAMSLPGLIVGFAAIVGLYVGLRLVFRMLAGALLRLGRISVRYGTALMKLATVALAFGAASLMMASAVMIVVVAIRELVNIGWAAIPALLGVAAILGTMIGVLFAFSTAGAPLVPVMLAVGAAFLMMGAAVWLVAAAVEMIVNSFVKLGESAMQVVDNAGALFTAVGIISVALVALAVVGAVTAIPLLALGVALTVVGAAALMISSAFEAAAAAIKVFADIENVKDAVAGMTLAIRAMMFTMAGISIVLAPVLPLMLIAAGVLMAVGAAAYFAGKGMDMIVGALEKFGDRDMVIAGVEGMAVALLGMAGIALVIGPVLPVLILMGVAMMSIGAGAWSMAQGLSASAKAVQEFAEVDTSKLLQVGRDLMAVGAMIESAAAAILLGSLLMAPATVALVYALGTLNAILWLIPASRLRTIGEAVGELGDGFRSFASGLDMISNIATRDGSFGELAITLSSALDELEGQALRADGIADSFVRMNEAIAQALAGPPEPVYGDVANALRNKMDAIEEQAARAEAIYAPIEGIAEQAELALAMSGEPAPEAFAEPVVGGLAPGTDEDVMAFSNFTNLRKQTLLLEQIRDGQATQVMADMAQAIADVPGKVGEAVADAVGGAGEGGEDVKPVAGRGAGEE